MRRRDAKWESKEIEYQQQRLESEARNTKGPSATSTCGKGPAYKMYESSNASLIIMAVVKKALGQEPRYNQAGWALAYAVFGGDYGQCNSCHRYMASSALESHGMKECRKFPILMPKFKDKYFCPYGCGEFARRNDILGHLISHNEFTLRKWGLSKTMLRFQYTCPDYAKEEKK